MAEAPTAADPQLGFAPKNGDVVRDARTGATYQYYENPSDPTKSGWGPPGIPFHKLTNVPGPPGAFTPEEAKDVIKSAGTGLVRGAAAVAGLPGDALDLGYRGIEAAGGPPADLMHKLGHWPTSPEIVSKVEKKITGPLHEPESLGGRIAESVGEFAPAGMVGPGSVARKLGQYVVAPGVGSELLGEAGAHLGPSWETAGRVGGALVAPGAARRTITPFPTTPGRTAAVNTLLNEGIVPSAGQQTGSTGLRYVESALADVPFAPERAREIRENTAEAFTAAALRRAGINARRATPDVIDGAHQDIGREYDRLTANNNMDLDPQLQNDLLNSVINYYHVVNPHMRSPLPEHVINSVATWAGQQGGTLTGEQYQTLRSQLRAASRGATDPYLANTISNLTEAVDDAMERTIAANNPADAGAFGAVRRRYRNLIPLERAAAGAGEDAAAGLISPARLRAAVVANEGTRAYARGQGDFADLVRAGNEVLTPLPNSGTAQRQHVHSMIAALAGIPGYLVGGGEGAVAGMLGGHYGSEALGPLVTPLISRAVFSDALQGNAGRRGYLNNQMVPRLPPGQEELAQRLMIARALAKGAEPNNTAPNAP